MENRFDIGDEVYHVSPNSEKGIVIEITYVLSTKKYIYTVVTSWDNEYVCSEHELTAHQNF